MLFGTWEHVFDSIVFTPLEEAKEQIVFNAEVAHPVVLSNSGALYHPERLVP